MKRKQLEWMKNCYKLVTKLPLPRTLFDLVYGIYYDYKIIPDSDTIFVFKDNVNVQTLGIDNIDKIVYPILKNEHIRYCLFLQDFEFMITNEKA